MKPFLFLLAIDCGIVKTPQNGSVLGEVTTYPNVLRFYCDEGFTLHGADIITCQASGSWSGTAPICKGNLRIMIITLKCLIQF